MLKHKRMNTSKKDDLKDVAKEETMGMTVKGKEAKKNKEMDEAVGKKDSVEVGKGVKGPGNVEAEVDKDVRSKREDKKIFEEGEKMFAEGEKIFDATEKKETETETESGSGSAMSRNEKVNHGGKKTETEVEKLSKTDGGRRGGEKVVGDGEENDEEEQGARGEATEVQDEASMRIQGLRRMLKEEKGKMDKLGKEGTSNKQDMEVSTNKVVKGGVSEDKKDSDLEKVSAGEKASTLEKVLEELEPTEDEKCCGFMDNFEPVGGRYKTDLRFFAEIFWSRWYLCFCDFKWRCKVCGKLMPKD